MRKISYITDVRLPTEKAHGIQIMKACEAFADSGIDVELIVPERENSIKQDPFDFYGVKRNFSIRKIKSLSTLKFEKIIGPLAYWIQNLIFLLKLRKIDIFQDTLVYTRSVEVAWYMAQKGLKVAYEAHSWPKSKVWLQKLLLRSVAHIVCNSKGTEMEYKKAGFNNTLAVSNGVDLRMFSGLSKSTDLLKEINFPEDKKIVMYTGHLYAWKGVDTIFQTAKLCLNYPQIIFVLVGGMHRDVVKYHKIAQTENLNNIILIGHKEQKEIPKYLACADVLLLPNVPISVESEKYTSPIKMFEYMASGKPIVASNLSSIREILNENNSILVKPADAEDLIRGIKEALEKNISPLVQKAFDDVQNYTWDKRAKKIIQFLNI